MRKPATKKSVVPEIEVVRLWQKRMRRQRTLNDSAGLPIKVIYPGRLNSGRGGDFRDAVISAGSKLKSGCIEIHSRSSGWKVHGHQSDPGYNQVVLHVALEEDTASSTVRQDGEVVPTVILSRNPRRGKERCPASCLTGGRGRKAGVVRGALLWAGIERLKQKAERFRQDFADRDSGQSLYLGVLESLGYSQNSRPFIQLGRSFPLTACSTALDAPGQEKRLLRLQAALLGAAGLMPSQRGQASGGDSYVRDLELSRVDMPVPAGLPVCEWEFFRVRPGNYPVRRIIALSYLLLRFQEKGWQASCEEIVYKASDAQGIKALEDALLVPATGYWSGRYDFGGSANSSAGGALLGRERAREIAVNVLLPFMYFRAERGGAPLAAAEVGALFRRYPRGESNSIERHMLEQLSLDSRQVDSACLQQGLVHIYKQYCILGKCSGCPLRAAPEKTENP